jgi:hypothetical protein
MKGSSLVANMGEVLLAYPTNYSGKVLFPTIRLSTNVVRLNKGPIYVNSPIAIYPSKSIIVYILQHY